MRRWNGWELVAGLVVLVGGATLSVTLVETLLERQRIDALVPPAAAALRVLRARLAAQGIKTTVGQTARTDAEEKAVVDRGASATERSWHKLHRAVDLYPHDPATGLVDLRGRNLELFKLMHREAAGLGWRGIAFNADGTRKYITTSKGKVWDGGHLEFPQGMTYAQAGSADRKAGYYA